MANNLVIGYFGYKTNKLDGQTIKTRTLYKALLEIDSKAVLFDTEDIKYSKASFIKLVFLSIKADNIFYLPAHNNLTRFFPILFKLSKIFKFKIYYFMIGGWLVEFLKNKKELVDKLQHIEKIYCETYTIKKELYEQYNFSNLDYFPNFRIFDFVPKYNSIDINNVKAVYLGRINEGKGILDLFTIEKMLSEKGVNNLTIDLYGQIEEEFKQPFYSFLDNSNFIKYKGVVDPKEIYIKIAKYDFMLFPTHFYTEGLPGTVLDAYIAGMPVVASNWKHAQEFINDNETGFIYEFKNIKALEEVLEKISENPTILEPMKIKAFEKAKDFSKDKASEILKKIIKK